MLAGKGVVSEALCSCVSEERGDGEGVASKMLSLLDNQRTCVYV
jgi:hypothetical protein